MCVLASAVDIDLLTHREAVTGYPAGHRLASLYYMPLHGDWKIYTFALTT